MQINNSHFSSIEQVTGQFLGQTPVKDTGNADSSFYDILEKTRQDAKESSASTDAVLKFSKHAGERLADRNIQLTEEQLSRLGDGAQKANAKGIKESLVLMDGLAFIVNTKSNTVITAMNQTAEDGNIYTNIDGAVII